MHVYSPHTQPKHDTDDALRRDTGLSQNWRIKDDLAVDEKKLCGGSGRTSKERQRGNKCWQKQNEMQERNRPLEQLFRWSGNIMTFLKVYYRQQLGSAYGNKFS